MKSFLLLGALFLNSIICLSQVENSDDNVVLLKVTRVFRFVTGDKDNPVQIKELSTRLYSCLSYRSSTDFIEFSNETETIDDVDVHIGIYKVKYPSHNYHYYEADGLFFSDARISKYTLDLSAKGIVGKVELKKTYLDPKYFTRISFMENVPVEEQEIKIIVPDWMKLDLKELNFEKYNIKKTISTTGGETIYSYTINKLPLISFENDAPGSSYYAPHLLVMCKSAELRGTTYTYFNTLKDQYNWYHQLVLKTENNEILIKQKAQEITQGAISVDEKVKKIFHWVQDNIRYIAFENGIAGFKPESAQEVIRKKYGDCKGMANLVCELIKSLGIDARRCWLGTRHLAYDYNTPCLAVDNHMIAAWIKNGKPVYLDATDKYIGFGEIAERIQGRQTLMENGDDFVLENIPVESYLQNTTIEKRILIIDGTFLTGHVFHTWKGENKEFLLSGLNEMKQEKQETALKNYLSEENPNFIMNNMKTTDLSDYNRDLSVEYDVQLKDAISVFDKEMFLAIDNRRILSKFKIDTLKRKLPYWFAFKDHQIFTTEIKLPEGMKCDSLPANLNIHNDSYDFICSYKAVDGKLLYKCEIVIKNTILNPEKFTEWNRNISELNNFYNQQIVLTNKN